MLLALKSQLLNTSHQIIKSTYLRHLFTSFYLFVFFFFFFLNDPAASAQPPHFLSFPYPPTLNFESASFPSLKLFLSPENFKNQWFENGQVR